MGLTEKKRHSFVPYFITSKAKQCYVNFVSISNLVSVPYVGHNLNLNEIIKFYALLKQIHCLFLVSLLSCHFIESCSWFVHSSCLLSPVETRSRIWHRINKTKQRYTSFRKDRATVWTMENILRWRIRKPILTWVKVMHQSSSKVLEKFRKSPQMPDSKWHTMLWTQRRRCLQSEGNRTLWRHNRGFVALNRYLKLLGLLWFPMLTECTTAEKKKVFKWISLVLLSLP